MDTNEARRSFDQVPAIYHAARPTYPDELFDALFAGLPPCPSIIEVGPGTGQATRALLDRGATVRAVEIGPAMASFLRSQIQSSDLHVTVGDFEDAPSSAEFRGAFDALVAATSYHWVSPDAQLDRPAELLRCGGTVAVIDTIQVSSPVDQGFFAAVNAVYARHAQGHTGPPAPSRREVDPPLRQALDADPRFTEVEVLIFDWDQTYTAAGYRQLMLSYSVTQLMDPEARTALLDDVEAFVNQRFGGVVTRPLVAALTMARLAVSPTVPA